MYFGSVFALWSGHKKKNDFPPQAVMREKIQTYIRLGRNILVSCYGTRGAGLPAPFSFSKIWPGWLISFPIKNSVSEFQIRCPALTGILHSSGGSLFSAAGLFWACIISPRTILGLSLRLSCIYQNIFLLPPNLFRYGADPWLPIP